MTTNSAGLFKKGHIPWMKGKHHSDETRKKISVAKQNLSEETIQKMRAAQCGKHVGEKNSMFGKTHSDEVKKRLRDINIGKPSKFKGKHHTEETRKIMSENRKGKLCGEKNPMYGKKGEEHPIFGLKRSRESCIKISESRKIGIASGKIAINKKCGKENPMYGLHGENHPFYGRKHTNETCKKLSIINSKENNPSWKGGTSFYPYCEKFDDKRRKAVREFFNNLCICTGEPSYGRALSVHHIDHDKDQGCNGKPFNLVPMCAEHHAKEVHNKEEYKDYINKTLREGFKWGIWNEQEYMEKVMY